MARIETIESGNKKFEIREITRFIDDPKPVKPVERRNSRILLRDDDITKIMEGKKGYDVEKLNTYSGNLTPNNNKEASRNKETQTIKSIEQKKTNKEGKETGNYNQSNKRWETKGHCSYCKMNNHVEQEKKRHEQFNSSILWTLQKIWTQGRNLLLQNDIKYEQRRIGNCTKRRGICIIQTSLERSERRI